MRGTFTYTFDSDGLHTTGASIEVTIHWAAIRRARQSKRFRFVFIAWNRAYCIPVKEMTDQGVFDEVRNIVRQHADYR
jgi:hypothetical protein